MTNKTQTDETLTTPDNAAAELRVSVKRLFDWMESEEWVVRNDNSIDPVPGQLSQTKNLALNKRGECCITSKGMTVIREQLKPKAAPTTIVKGRKTRQSSTAIDDDEVPY